MESVYENLKNHFRRKLSCFRLELLGFDLLKGVAVVLFTFLLFLFFYAGLLSFFRLLPDFKYVLYLILFLLLGVEFFFFYPFTVHSVFSCLFDYPGIFL